MITKKLAQKYLDLALSTGGDFAEIFVERNAKTRLKMVNKELESANSGVTFGLGVRIYNGLESVYAYSNDMDENKISQMILNLVGTISNNDITKAKELIEIQYEAKHPIKIAVEEVPMSLKKDVCLKASDAALNYDEVIKKCIVNYLDDHRTITIYNSEGKMISDDQTRCRIMIYAIAQDGEMMQDGYVAPGAHKGFEFFDEIDVEAQAIEAARSAKVMLYADDCPSGEMDVVIDNGFGGVIFHEACGHSLEATSVAKGTSVFTNKLGEKIASSVVSAVDDGTIVNAWGSNNIDDEGNFTQRNLLIENGILKSYLVDTLNGKKMNTKSTSSSRRENYTFEPTSRMSNTFILNGESTFDEIITSTSKGLYAKKMGGGSVNPATGEFNFACLEAYLIEDGKITKPVKGATLVGNGSQVLLDIDMVANNGSCAQGMCGSLSGSIPTDVGQPTLRVKNITVGGKGGSFND